VARELWLLRHGDAEEADGRPDAERRLTPKGEHQASTAGRALDALGVEFSLVLTSPRVRAADTARLACDCLGAEPRVHEPLSGGFDRDDALEVLAGEGEGARVLVVGHEPDFSQLVHDVTGGRVGLKKGGIAALAVGRSGGELLALLRPAELEAIAAD
jgi:phosphohistidine phosphatase